MQVTILGAGGHVGRLVTCISLERGYKVVAMVHSHNPFDAQEGLTVVEGDIYQATDIDRAISGSRAVISTLGSWHTTDKNILESAIKLLIPAMTSQNISRLISVTGNAAFYDPDRPRWFNRLEHFLLGNLAPKILKDGEAHLALLAASDLDWTSLRSPVMTQKGSTEYSLRSDLGHGIRKIPMVAVATAMVDQIDNQAWLRRAPVIYSA